MKSNLDEDASSPRGIRLVRELEKTHSELCRAPPEQRDTIIKRIKFLEKELIKLTGCKKVVGTTLERLFLTSKRVGDYFFIATKDTNVIKRHKKRYEIASEIIRTGDTVVDLGCGSGYGAEIIARKGGKKIMGFDQDAPTIEYARATYGKLADFYVADITDLAKIDDWSKFSPAIKKGSIDSFLAIEIIEHVPKVVGEKMVDYIRWALKRGGRFAVSTPIAQKSGPNPANPYHVHEYTESEFKTLLESRFGKNVVYKAQDPVMLTDGQFKGMIIAFGTKR
jgi:2-polyprenyl-3-methyl-5-hydroxy-6-metoxy-1,4-benzoquinol methylase